MSTCVSSARTRSWMARALATNPASGCAAAPRETGRPAAITARPRAAVSFGTMRIRGSLRERSNDIARRGLGTRDSGLRLPFPLPAGARRGARDVAAAAGAEGGGAGGGALLASEGPQRGGGRGGDGGVAREDRDPLGGRVAARARGADGIGVLRLAYFFEEIADQ